MSTHYQDIITCFYPEDTPLRRLLYKHSIQVRDKALALAHAFRLPLEDDIIIDAAMLHDIGIYACDAPGILCKGLSPYLRHGLIGAQLLRHYACKQGINLDRYAEVCLRHTGTGITSEEIQARHLPLPPGDYVPRTLLEKLICFADKFYSKSGNMEEKSYMAVQQETSKFGPEALQRLETLRLDIEEARG